MFTPDDIADLLNTAREAVQKDLLPALPEEQRMAALMVANALSIASRYLTAGPLDTTALPPGSSKDLLLARCHTEVAIANPKALPKPA